MSILKLTNKMKETFISDKQDFDNYLKTNLVGKTKVNVQDSITAKESQINELLKDSYDRAQITHKDHYDNNRNELLSHKDEKLGTLKNDKTSTHEEQENKSLSSILSDIDDASHKSNHLHLAESPSSSFSSSSDNSSSSSSTSDSFITSDYSSIETDELSALSKIDKKAEQDIQEILRQENFKRQFQTNL